MTDTPQINIVKIDSPKAEVSTLPTRAEIVRGGNRWALDLQLTWDVLPEDIVEQFEGDCPEDFAWRALQRVRAELDKFLEESGFAHYHLRGAPKRVTDL
jgi:hypothetical protein